MDIALSAEDLAFRDEVRTFLDTEFDTKMQAYLKSRGSKGMVEWQREALCQGLGSTQLAGRARWYGLDCDTKIHLGVGAIARGIPDVVPFGLVMVANVIMAFGTDEQKEYFLPRILKSEDWWCQGYRSLAQALT